MASAANGSSAALSPSSRRTVPGRALRVSASSNAVAVSRRAQSHSAFRCWVRNGPSSRTRSGGESFSVSSRITTRRSPWRGCTDEVSFTSGGVPRRRCRSSTLPTVALRYSRRSGSTKYVMVWEGGMYGVNVMPRPDTSQQHVSRRSRIRCQDHHASLPFRSRPSRRPRTSAVRSALSGKTSISGARIGSTPLRRSSASR